MKDHHFDSHLNLLLYKWRTGMISDEEVIHQLKKDQYQSKAKGRGIYSLLLIAMGEKAKGVQNLKNFIKNDSQRGNEFQNLKLQAFIDDSEEIVKQIEDQKEKYYANQKVETTH
jgi:hypothetical protein